MLFACQVSMVTPVGVQLPDCRASPGCHFVSPVWTFQPIHRDRASWDLVSIRMHSLQLKWEEHDDFGRGEHAGLFDKESRERRVGHWTSLCAKMTAERNQSCVSSVSFGAPIVGWNESYPGILTVYQNTHGDLPSSDKQWCFGTWKIFVCWFV